MENSDIILSGPECPGLEFGGSFAEYMVPKLKSHPKDVILQVDCATNDSITCENFLRQTLEVAEGLVQFGLEEGDVVALTGPNCIRNHVTAIGIMFSGGILANFDQETKSFELQHLLRVSRPKFVFCPKSKSEEFRTSSEAVDLNPRIILLDSTEPISGFYLWEEVIAEVDVENYVPRKVADATESIVLICFSSGTTGWPKGVAISHASIVHCMLLWGVQKVSAKNENFVFASPLHWVSGIMLLINGCNFGQMRFVPKSMSSEHFLEAAQMYKPFFFLLAPHTLLSLVRCPNFKKYDLSSVKFVFSAGGALGEEVQAEIKRIWSEVVVCNMYGSTETLGGFTTPLPMGPSQAIGKLIPAVSVKVVDPSTGETLGPNKVGELRVKGRRVMNCYWNNEEATKIAFDDKGFFCMGDLVYYDEDQMFYFVGRIKEIIQYLTYEISPMELESFLMCLSGIKDVAIVPIPHEEDVNHLRALVVREENSEITAEEIIQAVSDNFTRHKHLTDGVQFVDSIPRTPIGKIRRAELPKMVKRRET